MANRMKRGVGYCLAATCDDYAKGVFLLNHTGGFKCPNCKIIGLVMQEKGSAINLNTLFQEVRVEYNFDSTRLQFRDLAIVRDDSIQGPSNTYILRSPLIRTEKRALKIAEAVLANLQRRPNDALISDDIPQSTEMLLSFDDDLKLFQEKWVTLEKEWKKSTLTVDSIAEAHDTESVEAD